MRLARLTLPAILTMGLLAAPLAAAAQPASKVYRIAIVNSAAPSGEMTESANPSLRAFFGELRRLGYVEGVGSRVSAARTWPMRPRADGV